MVFILLNSEIKFIFPKYSGFGGFLIISLYIYPSSINFLILSITKLHFSSENSAFKSSIINFSDLVIKIGFDLSFISSFSKIKDK